MPPVEKINGFPVAPRVLYTRPPGVARGGPKTKGFTDLRVRAQKGQEDEAMKRGHGRTKVHVAAIKRKPNDQKQ